VQDLIRILKLPVEFAEKLDASVRGEYQRLWQAVQDAGWNRSGLGNGTLEKFKIGGGR